MRSLMAVVLLVMAGRASAQVNGQGRIVGTVVDTITTAPIYDATIVVTGPGLARSITARTDMTGGNYGVDVPPGTYGVVVTFGPVHAEHASVTVIAGQTTTLIDSLDVSGSIEVTTVHEKALAPAAVAPVPARTTENRILPYSDQAILTNEWTVAWLLLDVDARGHVESFRFLHKPGHGLEDIAKREAFHLTFAPARDAAGHPTPTRVLWKLEWPPFWRYQEVKQGVTLPLIGLKVDDGPPCRGSGPLRLDSAMPVYRDCTPPDYQLARDAQVIRAPKTPGGEPETATVVVAPSLDEATVIRTACEQGDGDACMEMSLRETDAALARTFEDKACSAGNAAACVDMGVRKIDGREPPDREHAAALFARACNGGDTRGCELAAAKDAAALDSVLLDIVCAQGDARACYNRALGLGASDPPRAAKLYDRACLAGVSIACSNLGILVEKREPERAERLYQRACDDGQMIGCTNLGHLLLAQKKQLVRAREVLEKACTAKDDVGCKNLAIMLNFGLGGPRDSKRAASLQRAYK